MAVKYESDMTRAEKRKQRIETIRKLKGKARLEYLWTYYRSFLVVAAACIFGFCIVATMIHNLTRDTALSVAIVDAVRQPRQAEEELEQKIGKAMELPEKREVQIDVSASSADTDENKAKLTMVMSSVGGYDVVICGIDVYDKYKNAGAFRDITEILGTEYDRYKPYMTDGELDLTKCPGWINKTYITYSPAYVCVLNNAEHIETVKSFFESLI